MWYQAAAMVWCGGAMVALAVIVLFACAIVMRDAIISIDRKTIAIGGFYFLLAAGLVFNGLIQLV